MTGSYGRYLVGWAITGALLVLALTAVVPAVAGGEPGVVLAAVAVAGLTDAAVFGLVLRALEADARRFSRRWGASVALKVVVFGSAIGAVVLGGWFPVDAFVRALVACFVAFAHHEVLCLVVRARRQERSAALAGRAGGA